MAKICCTCKQLLDISCFSNDSSRLDGYNIRCRLCNDERCRAWRYKKIYGITLEEYDKLLKEQNGLCAICKVVPVSNKLAVDHDHDTGTVRGLLCPRCNRAVEWFIYYKDIASEYLEKSK